MSVEQARWEIVKGLIDNDEELRKDVIRYLIREYNQLVRNEFLG